MPSTVTLRKLSRESSYGSSKSFISTSKASQNNDFQEMLYVNYIIGLIVNNITSFKSDIFNDF